MRKTMLATSFIKVLQKMVNSLQERWARLMLPYSIKGCAAGSQKDNRRLSHHRKSRRYRPQHSCQAIILMEHDITGTLYILEDTSKGIKKALSMDEGFASKFTEKISVPIFTNDELVLFAKSYSAELGYKIDEMAILALHNRISNIERIDQATTLTEVKDIIDEAIDREAHSGLKKAISILTAKRYTDDDRIVLKEDHFREK